jgi:hypothetical protein
MLSSTSTTRGRLTALLDRRSVAALKRVERARPYPWTFLPLPAGVRRRAAIRDPFLSLFSAGNPHPPAKCSETGPARGHESGMMLSFQVDPT